MQTCPTPLRNRYKAPSPEFWPKLPFSQKTKSQNSMKPLEMDSWQQNHKMTCLHQEKKTWKVPKRWKNVNFNTLEQPSWIVQFYRAGHPGFWTLFNFFFENGLVRRYQVTNLSCDGFDLKLCPKNDALIAHLYYYSKMYLNFLGFLQKMSHCYPWT